MSDLLQFYPTPEGLAKKAWSKFSNSRVKALLDPSAGRADLTELSSASRYSNVTDCVEIDPNNIAILKAKGHRVVGMDFLTFSTRKHYSHIIMNPPFAYGDAHLLKAWDILKEGEIVAILGAQTIKNPNTEKKRFLVSLIEEHGSVEYIQSAFLEEGTERKTAVEVALIHLAKEAEPMKLNINDMGLDKEIEKDDLSIDQGEVQQLALKQSNIKNFVIDYNCAANALEEAHKARLVADHYAGKFIKNSIPGFNSAPSFNDEYEALKESAWNTVIRQSEFTDKFSKKVVEEIESQLEQVKDLEFTVKNIYGLLEGMMLNKAKMDDDMLLDVFDQVTCFHSKNRSNYLGYAWKSNDKHKNNAYRMKHTRFILPAKTHGMSITYYENLQMLGDFDKVFAMLDGQAKPEYSMVEMVEENKKLLTDGKRIESTYFSIRYYAGKNSMHFFPTKRCVALIERLNRAVGKIRNWIPEQEQEIEKDVAEAFWDQYENSEAITKELEKNEEYKRYSDWDYFHGNRSPDEFIKEASEKVGLTAFERIVMMDDENHIENNEFKKIVG